MYLHNCPVFLVENKPSSGAKREMEIKQKVRYKLKCICNKFVTNFSNCLNIYIF